MKEILKMGLDVGSTTVKIVILDKNYNILYSVYERHFSDIKNTIGKLIKNTFNKFKDHSVSIMVTGSGGLSVSKWFDIPFIQEVVACTNTIKKFATNTDVAIELGGEDAKLLSLMME